MATSPKSKFQIPDRTRPAYPIHSLGMRVPAAVLVSCAMCVLLAADPACRPPTSLDENWTCDFDATEGRPLDDADAAVDDAGLLPPGDCMNTCGPPVTKCTRIVLDASRAGALCPVCTF